MKRFLVGFLAGIIVATSAVASADTNIVRLFVDGKEIVFDDAPPQMINNRVMVPARPLAEALRAKVTWDAETRSVKVTSQLAQSMSSPQTPTLKINGEDTGERFWLDDNDEPMVSADAFDDALKILYPEGHYFLRRSGKLYLGSEHPQGRTDFIQLDVEIKEHVCYVSMTDAQAKGILHYTWDPDTNNLTVTK
jgi:hypothetical protein